MWLEFLRDCDVKITCRQLRAYKAGQRAFVHANHVQAILERGAARVSDRQEI
jgi:hypothetical protein